MNQKRPALRIDPALGRQLAWMVLWALTAWTALQAQPQPDLTYRQAYERGFSDGQQQGRLDRKADKGFDPASHKAHKEANSGFDPQKHDQDVYYQGYQRGYEDGYEEGFGLLNPQNRPSEASPPPRPVRKAEPAALQSSTGSQNEILLPVGLIMQVNLLDPLSTRKNERGDPFRVEVVREVVFDGRLAVPQGTPVHGTIRYLRRAGRIRGKSEMRLRFDEIRFLDGRRVPIAASVISLRERPNSVKDGEGTIEADGSKADDGKAVAATTALGAIIGVLSGGKTGGAIGAGAGAVIGLGGVLGTRGKDVELPAETLLIIRLDREAVIPLPEPLIPASGAASRKD